MIVGPLAMPRTVRPAVRKASCSEGHLPAADMAIRQHAPACPSDIMTVISCIATGGVVHGAGLIATALTVH